jgi:TRAP-type uncharacterized transport system substrate-binding protein
VNLKFAAEWGTGPAFTICGFLAAGLRQLKPGDWNLSIQITPGTLDNVRLLGEADADVAVTLPPLNARMAREGRGPFAKAYPDLEAIGKLPHHTLFTFIVAADLNVASIEEIRARCIPIRLGTRLEPHGSISFVAAKILEFYGLTAKELESWGGRIVPTPPAYGSMEKLVRGEADAVLHQAGEAIWSELGRKKAVRFLPLDKKLVESLEDEYGCSRWKIDKGRFKGVERDLLCLRWADLIVVASRRLPFETGYSLAQVMTEMRKGLEDLLYTPGRKYSHLTSRIRPEEVFQDLELPIHAGAERWAKEKLYLA